ncbi:MAG: ABC transporter permease [Acidobacteria bacterium]|nr:ABC transporter permease [Acidobacteriota bacterium]
MPWERWLYAWRVRLRTLLDGDRTDRELDDELQHHLALEIETRCAQGVPRAEARRQALAALGGLESTREHVRASRCGASLEAGFRDIRHGLRLLRRQPGFTAATVLTLALSIGATTAIFSFVDAVLLQPPPFPEPERLVTLWQTDPDDGNRPGPVGPADFLDWRDRVRSFERVAAIDPWSLDFTGAGEPEIFTGSLVTEGFFEMLGVNAVHGRTFLPEEYLPGNGVIVLTNGLWQRRFGGEADIIGRPLVLEGEPYTVIGVLGPDFELGLYRRGERDFFLPKTFSEYETSSRGPGWWRVMGRLRSEVTLAEAQAEMDAVAARLAQEHPRTNADVGARVIPLQARQVEAVRPMLLLLQGAVLFVLLIACVNVANLMLARCTRRAPEFAVRMAVGGGRGRLLRQLLTENAVITALGGVGGFVFAAASLEAVTAFMPADVPRLGQVAVNPRLLGFAVGLVGVTTLACGMAPALHVVRQNVHDLLRGQRTGANAVQQRLRRVLVATEVALALVLLVGAGLLLQSFVRLVNVDLGFAPANTVTLQVFHYRDDGLAATANFFRETLDGIRALPGVTAAGAVSAFPLGLADVTRQRLLQLDDRPPFPPGEEPSAAVATATPGYLYAMGIPLRAGRWFDARDDAEQPSVVVINEALARQHWPDTDPLGRRVSLSVVFRGDINAEIIGVVGEIRPGGYDTPPRAELFVPHAQVPDGSMTYVVRTAGDPGASVAAIQDVVWDADPLQTFYSVATVEQLLSDTLAARRFTTTLLTLFGVAALVLATLGIYGVIAVATAQRTREIGLRLAMGAEPRQVVGMIVRGAIGLAGTGVSIGLLASLFVSRSLSSLLVDVAPFDLATLASVSALLLLVAAGAAYLPARRAARVDPLAALRMD